MVNDLADWGPFAAVLVGWFAVKLIELVVYRNQSSLTDREKQILHDMEKDIETTRKIQEKTCERLEQMQRSQIIITRILEEILNRMNQK